MIKFACERFKQYIYGRPVQLETVHKPLDCPARQQRIQLKGQKYDLHVSYIPEKSMHEVDALSRAGKTEKTEKTDDKEQELESQVAAVIKYAPITDKKK